MSFKEEKRESIKRYLLDKVAADDSAFIQKTESILKTSDRILHM